MTNTVAKVPLSERFNIRMIAFIGVIGFLIGYPIYVLIDAQIFEVVLDHSMTLGLTATLQNRASLSGAVSPTTTAQARQFCREAARRSPPRLWLRERPGCAPCSST